MSPRPAEVTAIHTGILRCTLAATESQSYWAHVDLTERAERQNLRAFEERWFGSKSQARVRQLLATLSARFDSHPQALAVLRSWRGMSPATRRVICHWHLQLSDPMYRRFTGELLLARRGASSSRGGPREASSSRGGPRDGSSSRGGPRDGSSSRGGPREASPSVDRDVVSRWVDDQGEGRWAASTRAAFASKLLSAALEAGLVEGRRDPRALSFPRVDDDALAYLLRLLRTVEITGSLVANPYLASVGLTGRFLEQRLRALPDLTYSRVGDVLDLEWREPDLHAWASAHHGGPHA